MASLRRALPPLLRLRHILRSSFGGVFEVDGNTSSVVVISVPIHSCLADENPDLWKWLTGQDQPPEAVNRNPVFAALHAKVMDNLNSHAAPEVRARPGQPWVRGWDDKRGLGGPAKMQLGGVNIKARQSQSRDLKPPLIQNSTPSYTSTFDELKGGFSAVLCCCFRTSYGKLLSCGFSVYPEGVNGSG
ncbi:hypothetical protein ACLOJK_025794 [Asimina triloba]